MHNMRSKAGIKNEQNMNIYVPGRQSRMRYHETWLVNNEQIQLSAYQGIE